jgi:hypothetical protein
LRRTQRGVSWPTTGGMGLPGRCALNVNEAAVETAYEATILAQNSHQLERLGAIKQLAPTGDNVSGSEAPISAAYGPSYRGGYIASRI